MEASNRPRSLFPNGNGTPPQPVPEESKPGKSRKSSTLSGITAFTERFVPEQKKPYTTKNPINRPVLIQRLAMIGCPDDEVAMIMGLRVQELKGTFQTSITRGRALAKASIRHRQYQIALKGNVSMLIWLGKQILGQRDDPGTPDETGAMLEQLMEALRAGPKENGEPKQTQQGETQQTAQ